MIERYRLFSSQVKQGSPYVTVLVGSASERCNVQMMGFDKAVFTAAVEHRPTLSAELCWFHIAQRRGLDGCGIMIGNREVVSGTGKLIMVVLIAAASWSRGTAKRGRLRTDSSLLARHHDVFPIYLQCRFIMRCEMR